MRGLAEFTNERARRLTDPLDRFGALGWLLAESDIVTLSDRLRSPNDHRRIALDVARYGRTLADGARWTARRCSINEGGGCGTPAEWFSRVSSVVAECASVDLSALVATAQHVAAVSSEAFRKNGLEGRDLGKASTLREST